MDEAELKNLEAQLHQAHYIAIGKIVSNWAMFELFANSFLWEMAGVGSGFGACLTAQFPNIGRTLNALTAVIQRRGASETLIKECNKFGQLTFELGQKRNRVVHDPWSIDSRSGNPARLQVTADKKLKFEFVTVTVTELEAIVDLIGSHIDNFDILSRKIVAESPTWPDMHQL